MFINKNKLLVILAHKKWQSDEGVKHKLFIHTLFCPPRGRLCFNCVSFHINPLILHSFAAVSERLIIGDNDRMTLGTI